MNDFVIELDSVSRSFGRTRVLEGVTLRVRRGETFAFIGRNGAGKTTTIRMLMGLLRPEAGRIAVLGLDPTREALAIRRRVGYLAEDQTMYGWMRAADMIRFMAPFYPTWDHALAEDLAARFELPLRTRIRHLSKGHAMRLGLLLALAHRPDLVILDDPALGLDPIMRREFNRDLITFLQSEGRTVFYSSHLLYEVEPVADTVAILDRGVIVEQAATEDLRARVKRLILPAEAYQRVAPSLELLHVERRGAEVAATVDAAPGAIESLTAAGLTPRVVELNLDEIFEAYVAGSRDGVTAETAAAAEVNAP